MIPDVDHHQFLFFGTHGFSITNEFPAHMDGVFLSYFYLSFTCERAFVFGPFFWTILMSERISGRHALRHLSHKDNTHDLAVFALLGFHFGRPAFPGVHGTESATSLFLRAASLAALARCLCFLLSCAWKSAQAWKLRFVASQKSKWNSLSMVMRAHAAMSPIKQQ